MINFFGKPKILPLTSLPEDKWSVTKGSNGGKPMFMRINVSANEYAGHPELPIRFGIAVLLRKPDENGFPGPAETTHLEDIEDRLFALMGLAGRVVLIITTGGMREFVSYVSSPTEGKRIFSALAAGTRTHQLQHYVQADATWSAYKDFA